MAAGKASLRRGRWRGAPEGVIKKHCYPSPSRLSATAPSSEGALRLSQYHKVSHSIGDSHTPSFPPPPLVRRQSLPQTREVARSAGGSDRKARLSLTQSPIGDSPLIGGGLTGECGGEALRYGALYQPVRKEGNGNG